MTGRSRRLTVGIACAGLVAVSCGTDPVEPVVVDPFPPAPDDTLPYTYVVPEETGDGWRTGRAADAGMSEAVLTDLIDIIRDGLYANVHGIVVVKDGTLVLEEYFNGLAFEGAFGDSIAGTWTPFNRDTPHNLASTTKSIASTLVGLAIDRGYITSVDTAVYDFFPEHADLRTAAKDSITLRHLLSMQSGLEWDEWTYPYGDRRNDINALFSISDPLRYILAKEAVEPPGTRWVYNGGNTNVLGAVVARASGMTLEEFADLWLFEPLGISEREWIVLGGGLTYASGDLKLRPRDMAKIGQLFLDGGVWNGTRVLSESWVTAATDSSATTWNAGWDYGFQWWLHEYRSDGVEYAAYTSRGWGGQLITVFPAEGLVVAQTGGNYLTEGPDDAILSQFVLRALVN